MIKEIVSRARSRFRVIVTVFSVVALVLAALSPLVNAEVTTKLISPGVSLTEEIDSFPPEIIHVLTVDLTVPGVHLELMPALDSVTGPTGNIHQGREEVRSIATRHSAIAAVNGDYFPLTGDPLGAAVTNGSLYSEPYPGRSVMGVEQDGRTAIFDILGFLGELQSQQDQLTALTGIDRMVSATDTSDLVVFTPTFGPFAGIRTGCDEIVLTGVNLPFRPSKLEIGTVSAIYTNATVGAAIPPDGAVLAALPGGSASTFLLNNLHIGDRAEFVCAIAPMQVLPNALKLSFLPRDANDEPIDQSADADSLALNWATASQVVGGGPHLIVNGVIDIDGIQEGFDNSFINDPNPRTAVGVTSDGKLLLITVDGRQAMSKGVTLPELATILLRYGAVNAINLDGGGSTTMAVDGLVVNSLAGAGYERPVANAVCVFNTPDFGTASGNNLQPAPTTQISPPTGAPQITPAITGIPGSITSGQTTQLSISLGKTVVPGNSSAIVWGSSVGLGIGYVDQTGHLTALFGGQGTISAFYDNQIVQQPVTILSGPNTTVETLISGNLSILDPTKPHLMSLVLGVFAPTGKPVLGVKVHIEVTNGKAQSQDLVTNIDGYADTTITWKGSTGDVILSSPGLETITLQEAANGISLN
jgi:exopolysaccharide biosynthesis protein